jgi:hypothetical protein
MHVCKLRPLGQFSQGLYLSVSDPDLINQVGGFGFGILIQIQEAKMSHKNRKS